jgi:hypothetical protein
MVGGAAYCLLPPGKGRAGGSSPKNFLTKPTRRDRMKADWRIFFDMLEISDFDMSKNVMLPGLGGISFIGNGS